MAESSPRSEAPLRRAIRLATGVLARDPAGLLSDFDGTLSPIVRDPSRARLAEGAAEPLTDLARRLAVVAFITGRAPLDARALAGIDGVLVAGNHGTEWLEPGAAEPTRAPGSEMARPRLEAILERVAGRPGIVVEHKGLSATVHYRGATDPEAAEGGLRDALGDTVADGFELRHGRMSIEVRPIGMGDKGTAARAIVERFALRGVVVMGDDITDIDMFREVAEMRRAGRIEAAVVAVGSADPELSPAVVEAADVVLRDPAEAAELLRALARR